MTKALLLSLSLFFSTSMAYSAEQSLDLATSSTPKTTIQLPQDQTQWQDYTMSYLKPVLLSQEAEEKLKGLLEFTMPTHGNFDPINVERRQQTLISTHQKLSGMNEADQIKFLVQLHERHKSYIPHK